MARSIGQVIRRGENTFLVRIYLGTSDTGKRDYYNRTVRGSKKDADKVMMELVRRRDAGEPLEESKQTFAAYAEDWLQQRASSLNPDTIQSYRRMLKQHAFPKLGNRRISGIDATDITNLYSGAAAKLSASSIRLLHAILSSLFTQAFKANLIKKNPLLIVDPPKAQRREMQTMDAEQAREFIQQAQQTNYACILTFLLVSGCRPAEAVGVKWSDVNYEQGSVTIQRQLKMRRKDDWYFAPVKSKSGNRTIALPAEFLRQLKEHRRQQQEQRLRIGPLWQNHNLVFCDLWGNALSLQPVRENFKAIAGKVGLPKTLRMYDTRHTSATLLMERGTNPKVVSERLGHANIGITLSVYSHVTQRLQAEASEKLAEALFG
jgi:integrase